jgi:hypothetical protein
MSTNSSRLHVICHRSPDGISYQDLTPLGNDRWLSEAWPVTEAEARALVGGRLYSHTRKEAPSTFGGTILEARRSEKYPESGYAFTFVADHEAKGVKWEGSGYQREWYSVIIA